MDIHIHIEKRNLVFLVVLVCVLFVVGVSAYVNPTTKVGHPASETGPGTFGGTSSDIFGFPGNLYVNRDLGVNGNLWATGNLNANNGRATFSWIDGSGEVLSLAGASGPAVHLLNTNGYFRIVNDAWNKEFSFAQDGTLRVGGPILQNINNGYHDVWIQGGASTAGGDARNLALLGSDEDSGDTLYLNFGGEYAGGTVVGGNMLVTGAINLGGVPRNSWLAGACPQGQAITQINSDGSIVCQNIITTCNWAGWSIACVSGCAGQCSYPMGTSKRCTAQATSLRCENGVLEGNTCCTACSCI